MLFKHRAVVRCLSILLIIALEAGSWSFAADWQSLYYRDHPLTGKIYSLQANDWIAAEQLHAAIRESKVLLLGETHTNPDHHIGQASLIHQWLDAAGSSVIVMEMLATEEWQFDDTRWSNLADLHEHVKATSGKWSWELYDPVFKLAIQHRLPLRAANLTRRQHADYAAEKYCQVEQEGRKFGFCDTLRAAQKKAIVNLILESHCGYLQAEHAQPLVNIQIAKDASFALSLYRAWLENKVVFIAGAVHVRKDIGVPRHLKRIGINSLSIAFIPVVPEQVTPTAYIDQTLGQPFDYIIFTPSDRNTDPCVEFAEQLKKMTKHKQK